MTPTTQIKHLHIKGFRSLADVEITDMPCAAIMVGPNGSGKSNVIDFLVMVSRMLESGKLDDFVQRNSGASEQLFGGRNTTRHIEAHIVIGVDKCTAEYAFKLECGHPDRFVFVDEKYRSTLDRSTRGRGWEHLGSGHGKAKICEARAEERAAQLGVDHKAARTVSDLFGNVTAYEFHDTFLDTDDSQLDSHEGNLAAVLYKLEHDDPDRYGAICEHIKRILPVFDGFALEEPHGTIALRWRQAQSGQIVGTHLTSRGSLRFFSLVTLLNLPPDMLPNILLLDGPESGLHPTAIELIGGMIKSLSVERQVLVATQSPLLVNSFDMNELFVLDLRQGKTEITRHQRADYEHWLTEYSLGQLWLKNLLGGRP